MTNEYIQVFTTTGSKQDAEKIAMHLLGKKLAGCVQVLGPISSSYWWQGKIENAQEYLCIIKTSSALYSKLEEAIRAVHPYEVPEITAIPFVAISKDYSEWLRGAIVKAK